MESIRRRSFVPLCNVSRSGHFSVRNFCEFIDGYAFICIYAALVLISSILGLEAFVYGVTALLITFICLFAKDVRAVLPPVVLIVYSTSWMHTPQADSDFFNSIATFVSLGVLGVIAVAMLVVRMALAKKERFGIHPKGLQGGMIALLIAFLLNGALSSEYVLQDFLFGALIAASFVAIYFFVRCTGSQRSDNGCYFATCCAAAGIVIFLQIIYALLFREVFQTASGISITGLQILQNFLAEGSILSDLSINKDAMIAGWGMSNNFGGMLAMFLPASLYLVYKLRHGWLFYLFAFLQLGAIACTLSRTALLTGGVLLVGGAIILSVVRSPRRAFVRGCNLFMIAGIAAIGFLFFDRIREIFATIFDRGFGDSNRFAIWQFGWEKFLSAPLFGSGFYIHFYPDFGFDIANWVFPDMYHNIFVQIFASCGLIGMMAYLYHISQVLCLLFRRPTADRILYLSIFLAVSGASLLDNHIFHIFPALLYSLALGLWELDVNNHSRGALWHTERAEKRFPTFV